MEEHGVTNKKLECLKHHRRWADWPIISNFVFVSLQVTQHHYGPTLVIPDDPHLRKYIVKWVKGAPKLTASMSSVIEVEEIPWAWLWIFIMTVIYRFGIKSCLGIWGAQRWSSWRKTEVKKSQKAATDSLALSERDPSGVNLFGSAQVPYYWDS